MPYRLATAQYSFKQFYAKPSMVQGTSASIPACPLNGKTPDHWPFLFPLRPYRLATAQYSFAINHSSLHASWQRSNHLFTFASARLRTDAMARYSSLWQQRLPSAPVMPVVPDGLVPVCRNPQKHRRLCRSFEPGRIALMRL